MIQRYEAMPMSEAAPLAGAILERLDAPVRLDSRADQLVHVDHVARLIDSLPLDEDSYCYFRNRLDSTWALLHAGEFGAARYQLREVCRRLVRQFPANG